MTNMGLEICVADATTRGRGGIVMNVFAFHEYSEYSESARESEPNTRTLTFLAQRTEPRTRTFFSKVRILKVCMFLKLCQALQIEGSCERNCKQR